LKHYSPRARLILLESTAAGPAELWNLARQLKAEGETVGIMLPESPESARELPCIIFRWGDLADQKELARRLFAGLRELDAAGATVIVCPLPPDEGLGIAIRDRLLKAAR
jgi:L-threonylcarbamoyladenylate synthase